MLSSVFQTIPHVKFHNRRAEHRRQPFARGKSRRRGIPSSLHQRLYFLVHLTGRRYGLRDHRRSNNGIRDEGPGQWRWENFGALLRGHLAFAHDRRCVFDETQGDDTESCPGTDRARAAAGLAECGVPAAVERDGEGIV